MFQKLQQSLTPACFEEMTVRAAFGVGELTSAASAPYWEPQRVWVGTVFGSARLQSFARRVSESDVKAVVVTMWPGGNLCMICPVPTSPQWQRDLQ